MMRKVILVFAALVSLSSAAYAAFAIFQTASGPPQIFYNIVTDGGANCNGIADTAPNFKTFNTWARANQGSSNQVVLTVPNGASCFFGTSQSISGTTLLNAWAAGINNLIVEGTGATLTSVGGAGFFLGGQGQIQIGLAAATGKSARIQTVSAGATQVALTAASLSAGYVSRFSVDQWILITGVDIQNLWNAPYGYPSNPQYFEWRQITSVDGGTGVIGLSQALANSYLATWPNYNSGNNFEVDSGGPGTIYALNDTWGKTAEYRGLTISQSGQTYANLRNVTYRNVTFTGGYGAIPTQNETFTAIGSSWPTAIVEVDKMIGVIAIDSSTIYRLDFQSSSVNLLTMGNSAITNAMFGSPKRSEIVDTSFALLRPGAFSYGASTGAFICTRCAVTTFQDTGGIFQNTPADFSMSSGVISFANTAVTGAGPPSRIFVPGGNIYWVGSGFTTSGLFRAQALTQDATNVFVQTSEAGGFPPAAASSPTFKTHPAPQFTCDACTGDPVLVATNIQSGATPLAPLSEFSSRDFAPTSAQGNLGSLNAKGAIVSLTVNVTQAYNGTGTALLRPTGQFHLFTVKRSDGTTFDWVPSINLKQAGERIITPSGVTCDGVPGACSGDTCVEPNCFALPEAVWIQQNIAPRMDSTLGAGSQPLVTITLRTNQGVVL